MYGRFVTANNVAGLEGISLVEGICASWLQPLAHNSETFSIDETNKVLKLITGKVGWLLSVLYMVTILASSIGYKI